VSRETAALGDVCEFIRDGTHSSPERTASGIPVLSAEHVANGRLSFDTDRFTSDTELQAFRRRLHPKRGDVLLTIVGSIGRVAIVDVDKPYVFQRSVCVLRPDRSRITPRYLGYALTSAPVQRQIEKETRSVAQAGIYLESLGGLDIPCPPMAHQAQVSARLESADRLRRMRRYALELSEGLLGAVFLEIFGDPLANTKGWQRARLDEIGNVNTGNTPPRGRSEFYGPGIEWIKSDNILLSEIHPRTATEQLSELGAIQGTIVESGSSLVVCIAGSENSIGNVCMLDRRVAFNQQINAVTPREGINPAFLYGLLRAAKPIIQRSTTLAMKRMISKSKFESLLLFKPPLSEQKRFASALSKMKSNLACQAEAFRNAEHLFQTLLHEAFREGV
jgi:type I restriction enzyme, S subunit